MAHIQDHRKKLIARVRRLQGQLEGVVRAVEADKDCFQILQTAAACKGAFNGLLLELMEDHIHRHISGADSLPQAQREVRELNRVIRSYLK